MQKGGICVLGDEDSPIVPVLVSSSLSSKKKLSSKAIKIQNVRVLALAKFLQKRGYDIRAIRFPTVPSGAERIRITISLQSFKKRIKRIS